MTHQEYKSKKLWTRVDYDWSYWYQCVDLTRDYCNKVYWISLPWSWWSALNWWKIKRPWFKDVLNTPNGVPPQWAIIFFTLPQLKVNYGHVAVVDNADTKSVTVIEQNALGTGNGLGANAIRIHSYNYIKPKVLWWKVLSHN